MDTGSTAPILPSVFRNGHHLMGNGRGPDTEELNKESGMKSSPLLPDSRDPGVYADPDELSRWYLASTLLKETWRHLLVACILSTIVETCCFAQPFLILIIVKKHPPTGHDVLCACAAGLIIYNFLQSSLRAVSRHLVESAITKVRSRLFGAMQSQMKSCSWRLTSHDPDVTQVMFSMDVDRFSQTLGAVEAVVVGLMSLLAASAILVQLCGVAVLPALVFIIFTIILRVYACTWAHQLVRKSLRWTTKRLALLKDTIIRTEVIKILCLEDHAMDKVLRCSSREVDLCWRAVFLLTFDRGLGQVAPRVAIYVTVMVMLRLNPQITLQGTVLVISYFRLLEYQVFSRLPLSITRLSQAWQHLQRFQNFLDAADKDVVELYHEELPLEDSDLEETDAHRTPGMPPGKHPQEEKLLEVPQWEPEPEVPSDATGDGACSWRVYWLFLTSWPGIVCVPFLLLCVCLTEVSGILTEWWIIKCREPCQQDPLDGANSSRVPVPGPRDPPALRADLPVYTLLVAAHVGTELLARGAGAYLVTASLTRLHAAMLTGVLHTRIATVHALRLGTALNAFSKDLLFFANYEFYSIYNACTGSLRLTSQLLFICCVFPWVLMFTLVYAVSLVLLWVYTHSRATGQSKKLEVREHHVTGATCGHVTATFPERWFQLAPMGFWHRLGVNLLTSVFCACIILQVTLSWRSENQRGPAALVLIYVITLLNCVQDSAGEWNLHGTSLRNAVEYAKFEPEVAQGMGEWCDWPASGHVTFRRVSMPGGDIHSELLDLDIPSGQKVGVLCGDVTAGRAFLRTLLALEAHTGDVLLDDLEVTKVSVHSLRTAITVIHPELVSHGGALREYLDPGQTCSDDILWDILDKVTLKDKVSAISSTLRFNLGNAVGHLDDVDLQLVGVARAVLNNSQVVVVWTEDPCIDVRLDYKVQDILRLLLPDVTRIRMTPSVRGIVSCDRILILDDAGLYEYGVPWRLLVYGEPYYEQLAREVGADEAAHIRALAWGFYHEGTRMDAIPECTEEAEHEEME